MSTRRIAFAAFVCAAYVIASSTHVASAGLPAGQHTLVPKVWSEGPWHVTNYSPSEFHGPIGSLTPGTHNDLWFSVGPSIAHIDSQRKLTTIRMPEDRWVVSGIAIAHRQIWFSAGQSGKVGIVDLAGRVRFLQVVPRRDFPDLRDLIINSAGEMWFIDYGRSSIGYRSSAGRVVENPFAPASAKVAEIPYAERVFPTRMMHCMGKIWVSTFGQKGLGLYVIDENLRPQPFFIELPKAGETFDMECDTSDRLWLSVTDYRNGLVYRFDAGGHFKKIPLAGFNGGSLASDREGGVWLMSDYGFHPGIRLYHIDRHSAVTTRTVPTAVFGRTSIAFDANRRLWLGLNDGGSPLAVTELDP